MNWFCIWKKKKKDLPHEVHLGAVLKLSIKQQHLQSADAVCQVVQLWWKQSKAARTESCEDTEIFYMIIFKSDPLFRIQKENSSIQDSISNQVKFWPTNLHIWTTDGYHRLSCQIKLSFTWSRIVISDKRPSELAFLTSSLKKVHHGPILVMYSFLNCKTSWFVFNHNVIQK